MIIPQKLKKMLEGKGMVRETDMPEGMQNHVMEFAHQALDAHEVSDCQSIAHFIKQVGFMLLPISIDKICQVNVLAMSIRLPSNITELSPLAFCLNFFPKKKKRKKLFISVSVFL